MLDRVITRLRRASLIDAVVVATTTNPEDDAIARYCESANCPAFRGSETDVLDRYWETAKALRPTFVVRVTSDCPLIDPGVADKTIAAFRATRPPADYASTSLPPRTYPRGLDVEVFTTASLERAWREDRAPGSREHVTPYIYRNPTLFSLLRVAQPGDDSNLRWTVDTEADLAFVRAVYDAFDDDTFTWEDVLALLRRRPELSLLNSHIQQKSISA